VRYIRSKPEYYENVVEERATHEARAKRTIGHFVDHAQVRFVVTAGGNGSALAMRAQTSPLFLIDPLDFWAAIAGGARRPGPPDYGTIASTLAAHETKSCSRSAAVIVCAAPSTPWSSAR
jgi:hypothetical protein